MKSPSNSDRVVECKDTGSTQPLVDKNHCGRMAQGLQANPATIILPAPSAGCWPSEQSLYSGDIDALEKVLVKNYGERKSE